MVKMSDIHELVMNRAIKTANYFLNNPGATVRSTAMALKSNRSTVHIDLVHNLKEADLSLYSKVKDQLMKNKNERSVRGGISTQRKWLNKRLGRIDHMSNDEIFNNYESQICGLCCWNDGDHSHHPESVCEGSYCEESINKLKEEQNG